jgi:hypothetical protein
MSNTRRRAFVATLVGVLGATIGIAGAGHVYLKKWRRAVAWFTFVLGVELVLLSVFANPAAFAEPGSTAVTLSAVQSIASGLPPTVTGPVLVLFVLSILDAYRLGLEGGMDESTGPSCPYCGHEVDPELTFCPWCTERFEEAPAESGARRRPGQEHGSR